MKNDSAEISFGVTLKLCFFLSCFGLELTKLYSDYVIKSLVYH